MAVLEPGAGFGSWRALFGFGSRRKRRSWVNTEDLMTENVITDASDQAIETDRKSHSTPPTTHVAIVQS
jgi:hypothetical protein